MSSVIFTTHIPTSYPAYSLDQAASVICTPHSAIFVNFYPKLSAEPIPLPTSRTIPRGVFVCANSLVVSDKAVSEYPVEITLRLHH